MVIKKILTIRYLEHISLRFIALKGQDIITHGEAMCAVKKFMKTALKGRDNLFRPFRAVHQLSLTKGYTLR